MQFHFIDFQTQPWLLAQNCFSWKSSFKNGLSIFFVQFRVYKANVLSVLCTIILGLWIYRRKPKAIRRFTVTLFQIQTN